MSLPMENLSRGLWKYFQHWREQKTTVIKQSKKDIYLALKHIIISNFQTHISFFGFTDMGSEIDN